MGAHFSNVKAEFVSHSRIWNGNYLYGLGNQNTSL